MNKHFLIIATIALTVCASTRAAAQNFGDTVRLNLDNAIVIAQDSSLQAFIAENEMMVAFWQFRNYKNANLPTLNLRTSPIRFQRQIVQQFDPTENTFSFFEIQNLNSDVGLEASQNLTFSGGRLSVVTDVNRLANFGDVSSTQFNTTPIRIGLEQPIFAYNQFKWDNLLEPLQFETAKRTFVQASESVAISTINRFFNLAKAELSMATAQSNLQYSDTLLRIGEARFALATITEADILNLKLQVLDNQTALMEAKNAYINASGELGNFLNLPPGQWLSAATTLEVPQIEPSVEAALSAAESYNPSFMEYKRQAYEAQSNVDRAKKENRFSASFDASVGLNRNALTLEEAYQDPTDQQQFNINFNIPLIDWGVGRGRYILAQRQQETVLASIKQNENSLEQEVIQAVLDYNLRKTAINNGKEAILVADKAYEINKKRFEQGVIDFNTLYLQQQRRDNARRRYLDELEAIWTAFFKLREITLYDFEAEAPLTKSVEGLIKKYGF